ncbi:copper radical oxidase [Macrolepiota fuliginosa MF-IS2]|uniref:Copper radical oxidase n=1 Tax=Macrolepiota fuliginosa MF-IS2 TaxID=1400762 RepID=A0A9P5XGT8_9AGAR|nr:copper radical oxidase [Macrolepiota fuliginosa MF-IS2]
MQRLSASVVPGKYLVDLLTFLKYLPECSRPGQPQRRGQNGRYQLIGENLVSAQQMFLGTTDKVYIIDKVENNPTLINGHPAWAEEYALASNSQRPMDIITNSFCAGGNVLGNGTWLNVGGNQAVTYGGAQADRQDGGGPYNDPDGRQSMLDPCDDGKCEWSLSLFKTDQRWYPTLETLQDGTIIIIGGCRYGGYVNDPGQSNPTYEFFPTRGKPITSPHLQRTLPTNLYPLTWLLPSGRLIMQSNWETVLLDPQTWTETILDTMPDAVRTYPASAGTAMLPMTPANNWTATILFCGGSNVTTPRWTEKDFIVTQQRASSSCVKITPDMSPSYHHDDPLPEVRTMANFILLPDGTVFCTNGARLGTAGYGNNSWAVGQSYADDPHFMPLVYDPNAAEGQRWSSQGYTPTTIPRMYHSSATLLPDGMFSCSVLISGSNPNSDYNVSRVRYPTEYRTEVFYPLYYTSRRPEPQGLPLQLSYGGPSFTVTLTWADLGGNVQNLAKAKVVVIRTGFSTHSMNMGQRYVELESSYGGYPDKTVFLHVSQMPPNPAIMAPGPAFLFVVVNGVPSIGVQVMIGSGQIGEQTILPVESLPDSAMPKFSQNLPGSRNSGQSLKGLTRTGTVMLWSALAVSLLLALGGI